MNAPIRPETCRDAPGDVHTGVCLPGRHERQHPPLPTCTFAGLLGQTSQKVRATATVQLLSANGANCMKPWMAPDKTRRHFLHTRRRGHLAAPAMGWRLEPVSSGRLQQKWREQCAQRRWKGLRQPIVGCYIKDDGTPFKIGDVIEEKRGNTAGQQRADEVYAQDPNATWNSTTNAVEHSCATTGTCGWANGNGNGCANGLNGRVSPRVLTVALFSPTSLNALGGGNKTATIKNFGGVFMLEPGVGPNVLCADHDNVCGYLLAQHQASSRRAPPTPAGTP